MLEFGYPLIIVAKLKKMMQTCDRIFLMIEFQELVSRVCFLLLLGLIFLAMDIR